MTAGDFSFHTLVEKVTTTKQNKHRVFPFVLVGRVGCVTETSTKLLGKHKYEIIVYLTISDVELTHMGPGGRVYTCVCMFIHESIIHDFDLFPI